MDDLVVDRNPKLTLRHWNQGTELCPHGIRDHAYTPEVIGIEKEKYAKRSKNLYTGCFCCQVAVHCGHHHCAVPSCTDAIRQ